MLSIICWQPTSGSAHWSLLHQLEDLQVQRGILYQSLRLPQIEPHSLHQLDG